MSLNIKQQVDSQFEALNLLEAMVIPGCIVRVAPRKFILVVTKDRHEDKSFYYVPCKVDGTVMKQFGDRVSAANYINNSVMLSSCAIDAKIINHIELETRTVFNGCSKYTWHLTGDKHIDSYMANLDARYSLFADSANDDSLKLYDRQEDRNCHSENAEFVASFALQTWYAKKNQARKMRIERKDGF